MIQRKSNFLVIFLFSGVREINQNTTDNRGHHDDSFAYFCQNRKSMGALTHSHSGLRWLALALLLAAIYNALNSTKKRTYEKKDKMLNLFAMIVLHIQLLLGLILYFTSPKVSFAEGWMKSEYFRFYGMEHFLGMLIAIVVVTIGRKKAEKANVVSVKHKKIALWYTVGLFIIIASIPWPFREALRANWF